MEEAIAEARRETEATITVVLDTLEAIIAFERSPEQVKNIRRNVIKLLQTLTKPHHDTTK